VHRLREAALDPRVGSASQMHRMMPSSEQHLEASGCHTVLLVDDDPIARRITRRALSASTKSITLHEVSDSAQALGQAIALQPDLILLDLMMPGVDGLEVCRQLRATEQTRDIPVIMMTAYFDPGTKVQAFGFGADAFLARPVDRIELCTRIDAALEAARPRRLREAEQSATALLEAAPVGAMVLDAEGRLLQCNPKARALLGDQDSLAATLRATDARRLRAALRAAAVAGESSTLRLVQAVSPPRLLEVALRRVRSGGSSRVVVFVLDASATTDVAAEWLREARSRDDAVLRAGVLHDFASLLQVGYVQQSILAEGIESAGVAATVVRDLEQTLGGMHSLLSELRTLEGAGRPDAASATAKATIPLVLEQVARRVRYLMPPNIHVQFPPIQQRQHVDLVIPWFGDILVNLLTNARDAIGATRGSITIAVEREGPALVVRVRDDGPGIPADILRDLGTPFRTTKSPEKGTGLGLWMIKQRTEAAGGTFHVARNQSGGTTATLTYPAQRLQPVRAD
jgi:CheY-like chemotaxis protein